MIPSHNAVSPLGRLNLVERRRHPLVRAATSRRHGREDGFQIAS